MELSIIPIQEYNSSLDGIERASSFDYENGLTAIINYKITDSFEVSLKYRFMGVRPFTSLDEEKSAKFNQTMYDFNLYNSVRRADYQRFDLRTDYRLIMFG